jgi:hypothetical protein
MAEPFGGVVNVDIRDSEPDWSPFESARGPEGAPNVVYIVLDDVGFSAISCYGGPIETPNIDRIAAAGVRYTQWHTTALCPPSRSCLLTRSRSPSTWASATSSTGRSPTFPSATPTRTSATTRHSPRRSDPDGCQPSRVSEPESTVVRLVGSMLVTGLGQPFVLCRCDPVGDAKALGSIWLRMRVLGSVHPVGGCPGCEALGSLVYLRSGSGRVRTSDKDGCHGQAVRCRLWNGVSNRSGLVARCGL